MISKYIIRSRISEAKFKQILKLFCYNNEAKKVSKLTEVSRPTINKLRPLQNHNDYFTYIPFE